MEVIICIVVLVIVFAAGMLFREILSMSSRVNDLEKRMKTLEDKTPMRMPFKSQEGILDAMAALDAMLNEFHFGSNLIENAKAHLTKSMTAGTKREE